MQQVAEALLYNRYPISAKIIYEGLPIPRVRVEIQNGTPEFTAIIHQIRIHHGNEDRSMAFQLCPFEKIRIEPKDRASWTLDYFPKEVRVTRRTTYDAPPPYPSDDSGPGIDTPMQLFDAIAYAPREDSWVEIDLNEYDQREFLKGEVKAIFEAVMKMHKK